MEFILVVALFALGAVCASFMGLVAARLYTGAPLVRGRSQCDSCGAALSPFSLVPILSWLIARGRCLVCRARIGAASTVAELLLGALFTLTYLKLGLSPALPFALVALTLLLGLVLYDLAHSILPPALLWLFVAASAVSFYLTSCGLSLPTAYCLLPTMSIALLLASLLALIHLVSGGRAMGLADAPLAFGLSLLVGYPLALSGLMFSFWIGAVIGILILARRHSGTKMNSEVPFAPFLALGFLLAYFTSWDAFTLVASLMRSLGV
ncbi:MAG: prepilin peptidase [bacterium]|nr:prepilin peptidase [bacterium]